MRKIKIFFVIGLATLVAGCNPSLNPLYTEKDLVFEPALVGAWAYENEEEVTWECKKSGEKSYELVFTEKGKAPATFEGHLVQLKKYLFLDIYPAAAAIKDNAYEDHLIRSHTFYRIWIEGDSVRLAGLNPEWLQDMSAKKKVKLHFERLPDGMVLTASTQELQEFVLKYADDPEVFSKSNTVELHRMK